MTISLNGATVDTGVPAQNVRAAANPVISTAGNDSQAIARQQLPSAVPAPALLGAYSTGIAQQPKPPAKPFTSLPSSSLAAQFIAQDAGDDADLALFEPPPLPITTPEEPAGDDYLNDLRIARGDLTSLKAAPGQPRAETATRPTPAAAEATIRSGITQFAAVVTQFIRRPTIATAKGVGAYQLAQSRNALLRSATPAEPVLAPVS